MFPEMFWMFPESMDRLQESITIVFSSIQHLQFMRADIPDEAAVCIEIVCHCARKLLQQHNGCAALLELHYDPMTHQHCSASQPEKEHPTSPPVLQIYTIAPNAHG